MNHETFNDKQRGNVGKKHSMVTYMKKLSKHDLKDFTRITSHITYGFCDSIEDANCDDDVSEKYPLLGYTYFDHGYDVFLLCK